MAIIDFPSKVKERIYKQYPSLSYDEVPHTYEIKVIDYERQRIEEYDVVFWHRLLKTIYQEPLEVECELIVNNQADNKPETAILRRLEEKSKWQILKTTAEKAMKIQSREIKPFPVNWKYFIKLPSGGIIEIGTKDRNTVLYFAYAISCQGKNEDSKQAEKFISLLLEEANKEARNKLFDPLKEFKKTDRLKFYQLFNVYRANYVSAEFMLIEALTQEKVRGNEVLRYDARTSDFYDEGKMNHMNQSILASGMYFLSAITYFFMALEGFINIIFHAFLKDNLRTRDLNIDQRFDIEQKLKLMPALCNGFIQESADATDDIYSKFLKLKKFRNSIFHSKVEDALKSFVVIEDGFLYNCDVIKYKEQFLPAQKFMLSANDVIEVKEIVDRIIELILNSMTDETRLLTSNYILKSTLIPFYILDDGSLSIGKSNTEHE